LPTLTGDATVSPRQISAAAELRHRRFGDEIVVFDERSGDTHALGSVAGLIFERLLTGPAEPSELATLVGAAAEEAPERVSLAVSEAIEQLRWLRLIEPTDG
jgi:PqqD family protein of HPr-rel-A system